MRRFIEGTIAGRPRYFLIAWKIGFAKTIRFG